MKEMKVMIVHKYHYLRAGACTHLFGLAGLLEEKGHEVMHFSMHHPRNFKYKYDKYFVPYIEFMDELKNKSIFSKAKTIFGMFYSKIAREKFKEALDFFNPDVIHLHNIHKHLTISILYEARKRKIPVVWTLHDYHCICPNYLMLANGKVCESCKHHNYAAPIIKKCVKGSRQASIAAAIEKLLNDLQDMDGKVDAYLAPSKFMMQKFSEFNYGKGKLHHLPYFQRASTRPINREFKKKYFLYLGRMAQEKGISTLCEAANKAGVHLKIAGEGPLLKELSKKYSSENISFLGYKQGKELEELTRKAWFVVVPSEWYENFPFSVLEPLSMGVPVIGSKIGGIPELIEPQKWGYLFTPGSVENLAAMLIKADRMTLRQRVNFGEAAKRSITEKYHPEKFYSDLMRIYSNVANRENKKAGGKRN